MATKTIERFRNDPASAAEYLNPILEDGDQEELMLALRRISEAFGGVQKLARSARLIANTLYRTLSSKGNPELKSLPAVLRAMGMQLTVRSPANNVDRVTIRSEAPKERNTNSSATQIVELTCSLLVLVLINELNLPGGLKGPAC